MGIVIYGLTMLGILAIALILIWAVAAFVNKEAQINQLFFVGAHVVLYASLFLMRERYFFLIACIILLLTCAVFLVDAVFVKRNLRCVLTHPPIYYILTGILVAAIPFWLFVMNGAASILDLR